MFTLKQRKNTDPTQGATRMARKRRPHRASLSLERLEDRTLLAASYTVIDLPPLAGSPCRSSVAFGMNDSGWVVGRGGCNSTSHALPALWRIDSAGNVVTTALPVSTEIGGGADDVNNVGQIAGTDNINDGGLKPAHAVVWQADGTGTFLAYDLGTLGGDFIQSWAHGVSDANNSGQVLVAGQSGTTSSSPSGLLRHAVAWQVDTAGNLLRTIDLEPGATDSNANGVYKDDRIVGYSNLSGSRHAVVWQVDILGNVVSRTDLGTLPTGSQSGAIDINSLGHVAGAAATGKINRCGRENWDGVVWKSGAITDLGSLADAGSTAIGINDSGVVVGAYFKTSLLTNRCRPGYDNRAFVWTNGVMSDLNGLVPTKPKWLLFDATDINGSGQIVGSGSIRVGSTQEQHAYLARPKTAIAAATAVRQSVRPATTDALVTSPDGFASRRGGIDAGATSRFERDDSIQSHQRARAGQHSDRATDARAARIVDQAIVGLISHGSSSRADALHELELDSDLKTDLALASR